MSSLKPILLLYLIMEIKQAYCIGDLDYREEERRKLNTGTKTPLPVNLLYYPSNYISVGGGKGREIRKE